MTTITRTPLVQRSRRMVLDCRDLEFPTSGEIATSVLNWVTSFPQPSAMDVYLPSSAPAVRRLQCTLQGLGCTVFRVTKCIPTRF